MESVAKNLRRLRRERGMTQEEVADRLGVSFQSVSKWERGESEPSLSMLPELACLFDVSTDEIYGMAEIRKRQRLDELNRRIKENYQERTVVGNIPLIKRALEEYTDSAELMYELGRSYFLAHVDEDQPIEYLGEAIGLFNKVLRLTDQEKLREDCRYYLNLCSYYSGESAVAHEDSRDSSLRLIRDILLSDESSESDRDMTMKKNIESLTLFLSRQIWKLADPDCLYPAVSVAAEKAGYLMKAAELIEWLYEDGDCLSAHKELSDLYRVTAAIYIYMTAVLMKLSLHLKLRQNTLAPMIVPPAGRIPLCWSGGSAMRSRAMKRPVQDCFLANLNRSVMTGYGQTKDLSASYTS